MKSYTYEELTSLARGAVDALGEVDDELAVVVVVFEPGQPRQVVKFACQTNVLREADVARMCREVAGAFEIA